MTDEPPKSDEIVPETLEEEFDRRRELRTPLRVIRIEAKEVRKIEIFFGYASNISKSGIFIQTTNPRAVGTKVNMKFSLPTKETIDCEAEVVWTRNYSGSNSNPGMGMRFSRITPESIATVEKFVKSL